MRCKLPNRKVMLLYPSIKTKPQASSITWVKVRQPRFVESTHGSTQNTFTHTSPAQVCFQTKVKSCFANIRWTSSRKSTFSPTDAKVRLKLHPMRLLALLKSRVSIFFLTDTKLELNLHPTCVVSSISRINVSGKIVWIAQQVHLETIFQWSPWKENDKNVVK